MFRTPNAAVTAARLTLGLLCAVLASAVVLLECGILHPVLMVKLATLNFGSFAAMMLLMLSFPWRRKNDLLTSLLVGAAVMAVAGIVRGAPDALVEGLAAMTGAIAAWLPVGVEATRRCARDYGSELMEVALIEDRRRAGRRARPSRAVDHRPAAPQPSAPALC